jgi:hypothetical protein
LSVPTAVERSELVRFDDLVARRRGQGRSVELIAADYGRMEKRRMALGASLAVLLLAILGTLLWQVLSSPTTIGSPATESEALIRTNERLLEMVKWTISTPIIGGAALVGLNLYLGEARYNQDRAMSEQEREDYRINLEAEMSLATGLVEDRVEEIDERLSFLEDPEEEMEEFDFETGDSDPEP